MSKFNKKISLLLCAIMIFTVITRNNIIVNASSIIDTSQLEQGIISINSKTKSDEINKVQIVKNNEQYIYNLKSDNNCFPLSLGDGMYTIYVLKLVEDNNYSIVDEEEIDLKLKNQLTPFLQSVQVINWNKNMNVYKKAMDLTKKSKSDLDKVKAIYKYVVNNIEYDYSKAKNVKLNYVPNVDKVLSSSSGICYDYASLIAAMLRSVGVPTKLVMGYSKTNKGIFHAWNEVYLASEHKWITIDATYDAPSKSNNKTNMRKDNNQYITTNVY